MYILTNSEIDQTFKNVKKKPALALIVLGLGLPTVGHAQKIKISALRQYPFKICKYKFCRRLCTVIKVGMPYLTSE